MAIPESQLDTWSGLGSVTQSSATYQTIRSALLSPKARYTRQQFQVFLQGSYANDTNIRADSDVDVVIRLDSKHQASDEWFKPVVRIMKNMRKRLMDNGDITDRTAPSYYVECLLYNVPTEYFGPDYATSVRNCLNWLWNTDRSALVCAHCQHRLLGSSNVQWPTINCDTFLSAAIDLWNNW